MDFLVEVQNFGLVKLLELINKKKPHRDSVGVGDTKFVSLELTLIVITLMIRIVIQPWLCLV